MPKVLVLNKLSVSKVTCKQNQICLRGGANDGGLASWIKMQI